MERTQQRTGLINVLVLGVLGLVGFAVSRYGQSLAGQLAAVFLFFGFLNAAISYLQMRLEEREENERMEVDELKRSQTGTALFQSDESELLPARRSREQFERYFVPGFTILLFLFQGAGGILLYRWLNRATDHAVVQPMIVLGVLGFGALTLFLMGKYAAGLVRLGGPRLLNPSASYLLLGAYLYALAALAVLGVWALNLPRVDLLVARGLCVLLLLLAIETFLGLLLEMYRPRVKGKAARILYESRLVSLLSHPEGLITTAAQALDYQFGFKVSDTWFYRFMERNLAWLVLGQLAILLFSSCFVVIQTGEEALLERFGRPVTGSEILQPGFKVKLPWPIDRVHRFRTQEIQTLNIGFEHEEEGEGEEHHEPVLWTVSHAKQEFLLLVANRESANTNTNQARKAPPVSLLSASIPVQFQINNLKAWAYNYSSAQKLLEDMATREVVRYLVSADLQEVMSSGRSKAAAELRNLIQAGADALGLGAHIISVALPDIHPPVAVAASYEAVVAARQKKQAAILAAKAHGIRTNGVAAARAANRLSEAESARLRLELTANAESARFTAQLPIYAAAADVFTQRAYLETLAAAGHGTEKVIIASTNTANVILMNMEQKLGIDMFDLPQPVKAP